MSKAQEFNSQVPTENRSIRALRALQRQLGLTTNLPKTTGHIRQDNYMLESERVTPVLQTQMDHLWSWMTDLSPQYKEMQNILCPNVALNRISVIYRFLGWLVRYKQVAWESLSLFQIIDFVLVKTAYAAAGSYEEERRIERNAQKAAEATLKRVNEFFSWQEKERYVSPRTLLFEIESFVDVAEWLYRDETNLFKGPAYSDIPVMVLLKKLRKDLKKIARSAPPVADVALKWLEWDDFVRFVRQLEMECLPEYNSQKRRTPTAIARSYRRFLACALLCYLPPDRQRTLRELQEGKTLVN
ncbi:MAG TPA: hypothetical protein IGS53_08945 [Leptolyngbyaceae cyanobacterium M33_DOE_097]|uniref:Uncharacterized protein n=1 Tax=Oscillatoriales cyanobacterium SpSt-418 TaxID=2282169 RepID=A0A7C3KF67_9CYAN|nr:hypothetical protein [Leptolyngbyaceae cyanobacterium M33_DOE_097]